MEDRIDRAIRTMFLRRKLHSIEAKRAEKNSSVTPVWIEVIICLILSPVIIPLMIYTGFKWLYRKFYRHES
jgi:hypothetical protein